MKTIHVLDRVDGVDDRLFLDVGRQWQLHQDAVHGRVGVEFGNQVQDVGLAGGGRQAMFQGADTGFLGAQQLVAYVDMTGRIVTDQQYREGRYDTLPGQGRDIHADFFEYPSGNGFAVDIAGEGKGIAHGMRHRRLWPIDRQRLENSSQGAGGVTEI